MPLTVAQALQELPVLSKARVVAGSAGLSRVIRWTHIIDHPDVVPWVQEGHLLLTTAFALMLHPESQRGLIHSLDEKRLAGLLVNTGRYMLEIPSGMKTAAEGLGFPLIALPWEVDLAEVTHVLHERILQEQYALAEQADHIHQTLTRIVIAGGDLAELARQLGAILQCSVTIEDRNLRLLAHASREPTDEVRRRSLELGRTPDEVIEHLRSQGFFDHLRREPKPHRLSPNPALGFTLERIVCPILVGSQLYGYIWIIASERPLTGLDDLVIERGAVVAALILSRQEAIYETEQRLKARLFDSPTGSGDEPSLTGLQPWQADFQKGCTLLVLDAGLLDRPSRRLLTALVEEQMRYDGLPTLAVERGAFLAVLLGCTDVEYLREITQRLLPVFANRGFQVTAGLSAACADATALPRQYQQALEALTAARALGQEQHPVWAYADLGYLGELLTRPPTERPSNRYIEVLGQIAEHDRARKTSYLHTLEAYLDHPFSPNEAARALFIHRNTLYQRLKRIAALWQVDLHDPFVLLNLNMALKDWRLNPRR